SGLAGSWTSYEIWPLTPRGVAPAGSAARAAATASTARTMCLRMVLLLLSGLRGLSSGRRARARPASGQCGAEDGFRLGPVGDVVLPSLREDRRLVRRVEDPADVLDDDAPAGFGRHEPVADELVQEVVGAVDPREHLFELAAVDDDLAR